MKAHHYILASLFLAGLTGAAYAQIQPETVRVPNLPNNDLVIGFNAVSGTGASTNLEADLGSVGAYFSATAGTYTIGNLNTSLTNIYGNAWNTRSDLYFGVAGAAGSTAGGPNGQPILTIWASSAKTGGSSPAPAWTQNGADSCTTPNTNIGTVYNSFLTGVSLADIDSQTSAFGATLKGTSISTAAFGSWSAAGNGASLATANAFGLAPMGSTNGVSFETTSGSGLSMDLYELVPGNGNAQDLGYFTLASDGGLTFTAIPEASTYAALLGVASLGLVSIRRRRQTLAA